MSSWGATQLDRVGAVDLKWAQRNINIKELLPDFKHLLPDMGIGATHRELQASHPHKPAPNGFVLLSEILRFHDPMIFFESFRHISVLNEYNLLGLLL